MTQLVNLEDTHFEISNYEIKKETCSYTIETVRHFKEKYPDDEICWLIGPDLVTDLHTWHEIDELVQECQFVVAVNEDSNTENIR